MNVGFVVIGAQFGSTCNQSHTHTSIQCRELMRNEMIDLYMNMVRVTIIQLQLRLRLS